MFYDLKKKILLTFLKTFNLILNNSKKKQIKIKFLQEDFGSLKIKSLRVNYLRFNLKSYLYNSEIHNLVVSPKPIGFSSYKKNSVTITKNVLHLIISILK
jgi:hypothetical protein